MLMVLIGSQLKIPIGKWWEADGVGKSLSNTKDLDLDWKPRGQFPYSYFRIGNAIVKLNIGKWWEADGVGKSLSNPKDLDLDNKLTIYFPCSYFWNRKHNS